MIHVNRRSGVRLIVCLTTGGFQAHHCNRDNFCSRNRETASAAHLTQTAFPEQHVPKDPSPQRLVMMDNMHKSGGMGGSTSGRMGGMQGMPSMEKPQLGSGTHRTDR